MCNEVVIGKIVVVDTTKVRFFKQITTGTLRSRYYWWLLLIPQRYDFSSKSQRKQNQFHTCTVVVDTTKVRFFKQITTLSSECDLRLLLLLIPQRYDFSSKSQLNEAGKLKALSCCWYHKGTIFQANHNLNRQLQISNLLLLIPQRYDFSSKSQPGAACSL